LNPFDLDGRWDDGALEALQDRVDAFFAAWTHDAPPPRTGDARVYVPAVLAAYGARHERRRKRS
jgi:hypothetical protein